MKQLRIFLVAGVICALAPINSKAQQWYVRNFDFSTAINQKPDFRPGGTHVTSDENGQATGVLVYGTIGYTQNELSGGDGGFGNADGVILYNDLDGHNIWSITLGSNENDIISRVVEDSEGNIAVAGYTMVGSQKTAFLVKVNTSGFTIDWSYMFDQGVPTDMINVHAAGTLSGTKGYAFTVNKNNGKASLYYMDISGSLNWGYEYVPSSGNLDFNSLIQLKTTEFSEGIVPSYSEDLAVAGANGGSGYVARIDLNNGDVLNDFMAAYHLPNCASMSTALGYVSIDQWQDGDIVAFGYSGSSRSSIHLTALTNPKNFTVQWNRRFSGGQPSMHGFPMDINATAFGYLGVFEYSGAESSLKIVEYDYDGNIVRWESLKNETNFNPNWYFMKEMHQTTGADLFPYVDFDMECGKAFHFTGTQANSPNPPAHWSIDNVPHGRLRLHTESCMEVPYTMSEAFCNDYFVEASGPDAASDNPLSEEPFTNELGTNDITTTEYLFCESTCPQSACTDPIVMIGGPDQDFMILDGDIGYPFYEWSNGFVTRSLTVAAQPDFNSYSVDQIDANGCVTTKLFFVAFSKGKKSGAGANEPNIREVSLYPNPSSGELNIELPMDGLTIEIFDAMGKLVKSQLEMKSGKHQMDISGLAPGLFSVRITGNGINETLKLNKN